LAQAPVALVVEEVLVVPVPPVSVDELVVVVTPPVPPVPVEQRHDV
jgi:hypothetical protein